MKMNNTIYSTLASLATACCLVTTTPCSALTQSDDTTTQDQTQRRAKFATVRLEQGLAIGRPSGWRVKRSGSSVTLVPPPSVGVSVVVSLGPWDTSMRLDDDGDHERLRESHVASAPGFLAAGEAIIGSDWVALDYERDSADDSDAAMRIFVRPVGEYAVTLAVVGTRDAIDRGERTWSSIANTIGVHEDAAASGAPDSDSEQVARGSTQRNGGAGTQRGIESAPAAKVSVVKTVQAAEAVLNAITAVDPNGRNSTDSLTKALRAGSDVAAALQSLEKAGKAGDGTERLERAVDLAARIAVALDSANGPAGKGVSQDEKSAAAASAVRAVSDAIAIIRRDGGGNGAQFDAAAGAVRSISESLQGSGAAGGTQSGVQDLQKAVSAAAGIASAIKALDGSKGSGGGQGDLDAALRVGTEVAKALRGNESGGSGDLDALVGIAAAVAEAVRAFDKDEPAQSGNTSPARDGGQSVDNEGQADGSSTGQMDQVDGTSGQDLEEGNSSSDEQMEEGESSSDGPMEQGEASPDGQTPFDHDEQGVSGSGESGFDTTDPHQSGEEDGLTPNPSDGTDPMPEQQSDSPATEEGLTDPRPSPSDEGRGTETETVLKLEQGWTITLPRGWTAVQGEDGFQLRPSSSLSDSAAGFEGAIGVLPWDASAEIRDQSVLSELRARQTELLTGFRAVAEPTVRGEWARFDYESESSEGATTSARVFVRPVGSQAIAIFVTGPKAFIESRSDDWDAMAESVRKGSTLSGRLLGAQERKGDGQQPSVDKAVAPKADGLRMTTNQEGGYSVRHEPSWTVKSDGPATVLFPTREPVDPANPEFYGFNAVPWEGTGALDQGDNARRAVEELMRETPGLVQDGRVEMLGNGAILGRFHADTEIGRMRLVVLARVIRGNIVALATTGNDATIRTREAKARELFATLKEAGRDEPPVGGGVNGAGIASGDLQFAGRWSTEEVLSSGGGFDAGGSASMVTQRILELGRDGRFSLGSRSAGGGAGNTFESGLSIDAQGTWSIERSAGGAVLVLRSSDGESQRVRCAMYEGQLVIGESGSRKFFTRID